MNIAAHASEVKELETRLLHQSDPNQRLMLLDQVAAYYVFTGVGKAQSILEEMKSLLEKVDNPDIALNYHIHSALVENQLYNYEASESHFRQAVELVNERGNVGQQVEVYIDFAGTTINRGQHDETIALLDKASKLLELFPEPFLHARLLCREGSFHLRISNYPRATEMLLEASQQFSRLPEPLSLKDHYFLTLVHSGLGTIYQQNGEIEKSVNSNLKVLDICRETGMKSRLSWHYLNIGRGYIALNQIHKAEDFFQKAIQITDDSSQHSRAGAFANLGYCHYLNGKYDEARALFDRAEKLYRQDPAQHLSNLFVIENWRGSLFNAIGKPETAQKHLTQAFKYAKEHQDYRELSIICKAIADFYAQSGDFKNAFEYLMLHIDMADRHQEEGYERAFMEMEIKYETEKKRQEAELLRLQATSLQLKALRAQMNPHFIYNALNSIQHYITSKEVTSAAKYLAKFAKLMRQSLEYSDLEIISLEKELEFLEDYLSLNQKLRFEDNMSYDIFVDDDIEDDIMGVPTMIVQPYVENSIEHGIRTVKNGLVKLGFYLHDEDTILCIVEDNGIGRRKAGEMRQPSVLTAQHRSRGTAITQQRLELLHKRRDRSADYVKTTDLLDDKSGKALGTRVEILIPIVEIQIKK